jgi:hypothetical protein
MREASLAMPVPKECAPAAVAEAALGIMDLGIKLGHFN